jgi:YD repeat-containing protein
VLTSNSWSSTSINATIPSGATSGPLTVVLAPSMNSSNPATFKVLPAPMQDRDIGAVGEAGNASYSGTTFTVSAAGPTIYGTADGFHFLYQPMSGDGSIVARVVNVQNVANGTNPMVGVMIRETLSANSTHASSVYRNNPLTELLYRASTGGTTNFANSGSTPLPTWVKVSRSGSTFSSYCSSDGTHWTQIGSNQTISMATNVYVGLAVSSADSNNDSLITATFDNVTFSPTLAQTPIISDINPFFGPVGTSVTITGTYFGATQGSSTVTFNGEVAAPTSWNATSIAVPVPAGATTGNVVVQVGGASSNGVHFTVIPAITSLLPTTGAVGASVTIAGSGFGGAQGTNTVIFNGTAATVTNWTATSIVATVPAGATTGNAVVTVNGTATNGVLFTVVPPPSITSLSPTCAPLNTPCGPSGTALTTTVTITGTNFGATQGTGSVTFNGALAMPTSWSATSIGVPVPTGATTGNVVVQASGVNSNGVSFTVTPTITLSPTAGAAGASVNITGSGFGGTQGASTVTFNGTAAGAALTWTTMSIAVKVPAGATTGNVFVTVNGTQSNGVLFTLTPPPSITSLSPPSGPVGSPVTITGTNFGATQGSSTVTFNGTTATPTSWSPTSIAVSVPPGATTGNVVVQASGVNSNGVNFAVTPVISNLSQTSGAVTASVTITGSGFGAAQGTSTVTFNGISAGTAPTWTTTSIVVTVPAGATTGNVVVTVNGTGSNGVLFTVTAAPSITSLSATTGPAGTPVTITGANFGATQGSSTVTFNGAPGTPTSWNTGSIAVPVPSSATSGSVVVSVGGVASNGIIFTVTPVISSLSPTSAPILGGVTITGNGFGGTQGTSTVAVNGTPAGVASTWTTTSIVSTVPTGATTGNVVVTVGGTASNGVLFTVAPAPSITSLSTTSGNVGIQVTITGTNFGATQGTNQVTFDSTSGQNHTKLAASVVSWSASSIIVIVPSGNASSTPTVYVTVDGVASNSVGFTVLSGPGITTVAPTSGPPGTEVTITGGGFGTTQGSSTVKFNGITATVCATCWSATSIVTTVPATATTGNVVVNVGGTNSNGVNFTVNTGGVGPNYIYDDLGRLTGTIDGSGNAAAYSYDPVGNLLAIARYSAGQISIISFSPSVGATGTIVTIAGTGFSTTITQNTVQFNGTAATISSATANQLVVTVPASATTGPIKVTAPSGNFTSTTNFTVTTSGGLPSITSLSATKANPGAPLTITGTGFDTNPLNDRLRLNITQQHVNTATATTLTTTIPTVATSGKVSLITPGGSTQSSQDLYIPFGGHDWSTIGYSQRTTLGSPQSSITLSAGSIALLIFDATAGQTVNVQVAIQGQGFSACVFYLIAPNGSQLFPTTPGSQLPCSAEGNTDIALPLTGTYTVGLDTNSGTGGTALVTLLNSSDATATITVGGPSVTVNTTTQGQDAHLYFTGLDQQRVSAIVTYPTNPPPNPQAYLNLVTPTSQTQATIPISSSFGPAGLYLDTQTLHGTGRYNLWVQHSGINSGSETLQLINVPPDVTGTIVIGGPQVPVNTAVGQKAYLTFSATAGQKVSVSISGSSYSYCSLSLLNSSGTLATTDCSQSATFFDTQTLATTGTYTLFVNPTVTAGGVTLQLNNDADVTGSITAGGSAVTPQTTVPGQDVRLTFTGTANERVSMLATNVTNTSAYVNLVTPTGTVQSYIYLCCQPFLDVQTLAGSGTYTLWVQHSGPGIGTETLQLYNVPADVTASASMNGSAVPVSTTVPGQNASVTFSGTAGQIVTITLTSGTYSNCGLTVQNPAGSNVDYGSCGGATNTVGPFTLGTTGTYTILIDPIGAAIGGVTVQVTGH